MKDRKIFSALSGLNIYELNSFGKYVRSPYFNVNQQIIAYYEILDKYIKSEKTEELTNEYIWKSVFDNEKYNNQKLLKLNSDLVKLLEDFIAQKEFDSMVSLRSNLKIAGANKRNLEKLYNGLLGEIDRLNKQEMNQSAEFYLTKYQIEKNIFSLKTENEKKNEKFEIRSELNINKISDNLDYFYIAEKLRHYCTLLSWKKMYQLDIEMKNMDFVLQLATNEPFASIPPVSLYYKMYLTYVEGDNVQNYFELRNLIKKYIHLFPADEQRDIYSTAISYCINKGNKNVSIFHKESFDIYKEALMNNILVVNEQMLVTTYRNIVPIALRVEEFDWAENFISEYAQYVDEKYRENAVEFSLARLEFYRKNFGKVLDHLNKVSYEDVWYILGSKTLQLASYFELDEYDALESLLQSFKMYIRREKSLTNDRKATYINLVKFTSALMKINPKEQLKVLKLKDEIVSAKGVVSKPWLIEKVESLIKK
ncbi:MAG: hypothetical protein KA270_02170 [Saprospiraceae bacterium]|nr:hypothetical protein [Saprospiraceae bacterium]MBP6565940.1 hypothetical protein [Saprospiraceae bacterium]